MQLNSFEVEEAHGFMKAGLCILTGWLVCTTTWCRRHVQQS